MHIHIVYYLSACSNRRGTICQHVQIDGVLFVRMCKSTGYYLSACAKMTGYYLSACAKMTGYYLSSTSPRHEFERSRLSISFLDEGKSEMEINCQLLQTLFILYLYYRILLNKDISLHYAFLLHLRPN